MKMINLNAPLHVIKLADLTKNLVADIATGSYYLALKILFEFFIGEYLSVSELLRCNAWTLSESQFLNIILDFEGNRFIRRMRSSILAKYKGSLNPTDFVLAIDDTDNPKYSKYLRGVQSWRSSKGSYYGQKVLVIVLVNVKEEFALPLDYRILLPKDQQNPEGGDSGIDQALKLAKHAVNQFGNLPVVADSWFDSAPMAKKMKKAGITYVWEIKCNRKVRSITGEKKWQGLPNLFRSIIRLPIKKKYISESQIFLKSNKMKIQAIAAYNNKNDEKPFAYYASTDLDMPGVQVWKIFRHRWYIECLFRDLKCHLNFGRLSVSDDNASNLAIVIPFIIVTYLRINPGAFNLPEGKTISGMLETLKNKQGQKTIGLLHAGNCQHLIKKIFVRQANINKKPVITCTEDLIAS